MIYVTDNESSRQEVMRIIDSQEKYKVDIVPLHQYTKTQRGALHVWCAQCAQKLNDADLLRERVNVLGDGTNTIPWTMSTFKEDVYKFVLNSATGKKSTEDQSSVDPGDIVQMIRRAYKQKKDVDLPPWPTEENRYERRNRKIK